MANIPEHIHAFPRTNPNVILPKAVAAWDEDSKTLYIGDGVTKGGVPYSGVPEHEEITSCSNNQIIVSNNYVPFMLKLSNGNFYSLRGEDLSVNGNNFIIDITNALAVNNLNSFSSSWFVYFGGKY